MSRHDNEFIIIEDQNIIALLFARHIFKDKLLTTQRYLQTLSKVSIQNSQLDTEWRDDWMFLNVIDRTYTYKQFRTCCFQTLVIKKTMINESLTFTEYL